MEVKELQELLKHPGWQSYLELIEDRMVMLVKSMFALDTSNPQSFVSFAELKARLDQLHEITYMIETQLAAERQEVEASYGKRFKGFVKRILGD